MRGGEPMAFGVNEVFPLAMFAHAKKPEDIQIALLKSAVTVVLVDSVINEGTSIVEFVKCIRALHATIRIVVVAGVAQQEAVKKQGLIENKLSKEERTGLSIVTLRVSDNKYKGVGGTDTGHRLFQTTQLP
jgi:uracil phosphoribosyltransferase